MIHSKNGYFTNAFDITIKQDGHQNNQSTTHKFSVVHHLKQQDRLGIWRNLSQRLQPPTVLVSSVCHTNKKRHHFTKPAFINLLQKHIAATSHWPFSTQFRPKQIHLKKASKAPNIQAKIHCGPCMAPTINGKVINGPIPTMSIMLMAVACVSDKPRSKEDAVSAMFGCYKVLNIQPKCCLRQQEYNFSVKCRWAILVCADTIPK